ncbi:Glutamine amidotransferase, class I [hydrothermal vent metagenome]|uniref:Glutamine amidotransferase, class I n=1 Tax=hydrothermal vent metagenome TaxID=652676 RepID=A0A3B1AU45_9ZZZZ
MHIGLLQADRHDIHIEQRYGSYSDMFQHLFHQVDSDVNFTTYQVIDNHYPETINECDGYLITGSKESVYDNLPWIKQLRKFIVDVSHHDTKLVGICFGHQIIAEALGGKVEKAKNGWGIGVSSSLVVESNSWMHPAMKQFSLLVSHQDQVVQLPADATCFADSVFCRYAGFRIGRKIVSFQGHPEFSTDYLKERMLLRKPLFDDELYNDALDSLKNQTQHLEIAKWILNFFSGV